MPEKDWAQACRQMEEDGEETERIIFAADSVSEVDAAEILSLLDSAIE